MEIQQLRYVLALAQELSFYKAAKKVFVTQPTLSQQIKKLEDELGVVLFERSPKWVQLTEAGERFLPHAQNILDGVDQIKTEFHQDQKTISGKLKIGFIPTIGPYLLPKIAPIIQKKAPDLKLELYEETTSVLIESLKVAKFDLGLVALPLEDPSVVAKELGKEEFYLALSKKEWSKKKKTISLNQLTNKKILMLKEGHCFRDQALDFCQIKQDDERLIFEGSSLVSVINLVSLGYGVTFVPKMAIKSFNDSKIEFLSFPKPKPMRTIGAIWRMTTPLNKAQRFLLEVIEEVLR